MSADEVVTVTLTSAEDEVFTLPLRAAQEALMLKEMLGEDVDCEAAQIPLPAVSSAVLAKVIEFCRWCAAGHSARPHATLPPPNGGPASCGFEARIF